jgi:hypothetical protein
VNIQEHLVRNPLVLFHDLQKVQTSPSTAYLKGNILFVDGSTLSIFQHIRLSDTETRITDYRYHYMSPEKRMVFRYDNAPHHGEVDTHPHHKHIPNGVGASNMPDFKDVLDEATGFVIENTA